MPLYEYRCPSCYWKETNLQPRARKSTKTKCPKCDSKMKKLVSAFGFSFKEGSPTK